jgi:hypothetical protein
MDPPQTKKQGQKNQREKGQGKTVYSSKHVRIAAAIAAGKKK